MRASFQDSEGRQADRATSRIKAQTLPMDSLTDGKLDQDRERMRRALIYQDMVSRTGQVLYAQLATWDYQPTPEAVQAEIDAQKEQYRRTHAQYGVPWKARQTG